MPKRDRPPAGCRPLMAQEVRPRKHRRNNTPPPGAALPSSFDAAVVQVRSAQHLALALGGQWLPACEYGVAKCPACRKPGLIIFQCGDIGVSPECLKGCLPVSIYCALRELGLAVVEFRLS
jgi:hypothetical protein